MRALVSGMGGFVGIHLARALLRKGFEVIGFGLHAGPTLVELEGCDYRLCDLNDYSTLHTLVQSARPHYVFHLAALTQPSSSLRESRAYYEVNGLGTVSLLESLRQAQLNPRVLVVSSAHVYKSPLSRIRLREDAAEGPQFPYGVSKWMSEKVALQYFRDYGVSVLIARPFNHAGPGQHPGFVIPDFARQIARLETESGGEIQVRDLNPVRDFLDVRDVVEAYIQLIERGVEGEIYNVCSGEGISIREILNHLLALAKAECSVRSSGTPSEPDWLVGDAEKLIRSTGWFPNKSISETLQEVLDEWRKKADDAELHRDSARKEID